MAGFFDRVITVYGRKPALEALQDPNLECHRLHLADSNKPASILEEMKALAEKRGLEICIHSKRELSRISRKGSQDQGVAVDVHCPGFQSLEDFLATSQADKPQRLLAADGITNPQNVGMLVRSAVAAGIDGILWPRNGNAALGPLAIKASAGTLFRAPLVRCRELHTALEQCRESGYRVYTLAADAAETLFEHSAPERAIYVLGGESHGVSKQVTDLADGGIAIPMHNDVESLNVAVTAALVAFRVS